MIRPMNDDDCNVVLAIYQEGLDTGLASFETSAPSWLQWTQNHLIHPRLVADDGGVIGWAALSPVSQRDVYRGVAEISIYVSSHGRGKGVGDQLMHSIIEASEVHEIWMLQASIFPDNPASLALHARHEFRIVGRREKIAQLDTVWRDTLLLERRSQKEHI